MASFYIFYGIASLFLAFWFLCTFGPKVPADWHYYGWKRSLGMTSLIIGFSWLLPPIVMGILIYLGGFWVYQQYKEGLKKNKKW